MIRSLVEKLSRGIILKRKLPNSNRKIYVSPEGGGLRYWKLNMDSIDTMLTYTIKNLVKQGDVVWDIGTNVGFFSFLAAEKVGEKGSVLSVEPDTWLVNILKKSCMLNKDLNINVLPVALSNNIGVAYLNIANRSRSSNFLSVSEGTTQTGGIREQQVVPTFTLDFLLENFPKPNFLKIDVEGAEHLVFSQADKLLSEAKPVILAEVEFRNFEFLSSKFRSYGYNLFDGDVLAEKGLVLLDKDKATTNILAIPQ